MCSKCSVNEHFKYFYIDEYKTDINKEVEQGGDGAAEHFFLSKRNQRHDLPSFGFAVSAVDVFPKKNISADLFRVHKKQAAARDEKQDEYDVRNAH